MGTATRQRSRRLLVVLSVVASVVGVAAPASAAALAATATLDPKGALVLGTPAQPVNFSVENTGTGTVGMVDLVRPNTTQIVDSCPYGPTGWVRSKLSDRCRYRSAAGTADDLAPGATADFGVRITTTPGNTNRFGNRWTVLVALTPSSPKVTATLRPGGSLNVAVFTFRVPQVMLADVAPRVGGACPPDVRTAPAGSTKVLVMCGDNRANVALTPTATHSSLGGAMFDSTGTFSSGRIPAGARNVVLATYTGTRVSSTPGTDLPVEARIGSRSDRTSVWVTHEGFSATPVARPPVAGDDSFTTAEDTALEVPAPGLLADDTDPDGDPLTVSTTAVSGPQHGALTLGADGGFTYTPDADFAGTDSFDYAVSDGSASDTGHVTLTVSAVNDRPVTLDDAYSTDEETPLVVSAAVGVLANDGDVDSGALTAELASGVTAGTLVLASDGGFTYTPDAGTTSDSFTYRASDGSLTSNPATVRITVDDVQRAPEAADDTYSTHEDTQLTVGVPGVLGNDSDADGDTLTAELVIGPSHSTAFTLHADGSFSYTPQPNYSGPDSFRYQAADGAGRSNTATVSLEVIPVNDAPSAIDHTFGTAVNNTLFAVGQSPAGPVVTATGAVQSVEFGSSDADGDPVSAVPGTTSSANGGSVQMAANGTFTYISAPGFAGRSDSFPYNVTDGQVSSATRTVTVQLHGTVVWYVDGDRATNGDGRSNNPFNVLTSLRGLSDVDATDAVIFLYGAASPYTGGLPLETGQRLVGEPQGLLVDGHLLVTPAGVNPRIQNTAGNGIDLGEGSSVERVDVDLASGAAIAATDIHSATVGANTTLSGAGGFELDIQGGTGAISVPSTITSTAGGAVEVTGRSGSTTISGPVTASAGPGISLSGSGPVSFTGNLSLTTGPNSGFASTDSGPLVVSGGTATVTTTTGTPVSITRGSIGVADVRFTNVTSTGAPSGITLTNVIASSLQQFRLAAGAISGSTGPAVSLVGTDHVDLRDLLISDGNGHGILARGLSGLTLDNVSIVGAGDGDADNALFLEDVADTVRVVDSDMSGSSDELVKWTNVNRGGTLDVDTSQFATTSTTFGGGQAFLVHPNGTSGLTVEIDGSSFTDLRGPAVQLASNLDGSTGTSSLGFRSNTVGSTTSGKVGTVEVNGQYDTVSVLTITGNTWNDVGGPGLVVTDTDAQAEVRGTISGNTMTNPTALGISVNADSSTEDGSSDTTLVIDGNTITGAGSDAIDVVNFEGIGTSDVDVAITNNTVNGHNDGAAPFTAGIAVYHFSSSDTTCANVRGNTITGTPPDGATPFYDIDLTAFEASFTLEESPDTAANGQATAAYVASVNTASDNWVDGPVLSDGALCERP